MATAYPLELKLWLRPAPDWLEAKILAGADPDHLQQVVIKLDSLDADFRLRAEELSEKIALDRGKEIVEVHESGIDPGSRIPLKGGKPFSPHAWITQRIGKVPTVDDPEDPISVIIGYEVWVAQYTRLAHHLIENPTENLPTISWVTGRGGSVPYAVKGQTGDEEWILTGLEPGAEIRRLLACDQRYEHAERLLGEVGIPEAFEICGTRPVLARKPKVFADVLAAEEEWSIRLLRLARAIISNRQARRAGFDREMLRWIDDKGSDRLKMGIEDGFEMTPAYLEERLWTEFPGCIARPWAPGDKPWWKERSSPSDTALKLRRKVQERLAEYASPGFPELRADIGYMHGFDDVEFCNPMLEWDNPFEDPPPSKPGYEVIVVPGWLGRHVLAGVVPDSDLDYRVLGSRILDPAQYGILPPRIGSGDVPVDTSDFATAPPFGGAPSEDDIPF